MSVQVTISGLERLHERLSYLRDQSARRIGRAAVGAMAQEFARGIRRYVPESVAPRTADRGIGARTLRSLGPRDFRAKAGIRVGSANKNILKSVNRGKRKGVGVTAQNLHWFALGTVARRTRGGRYTGKIDKAKWGGFVPKGVLAVEQVAVAKAMKVAEKRITAEVLKAARS